MSTWVDAKAAAEHFGCTANAIRKRARRGTITKKETPDGARYLIPSTIELPESEAYYFDGTRYVFALPSHPRSPYVLAKEKVQAIVAAYSNDGDAASLEEVARANGMAVPTLRELLRALGVTHTSLPFTQETIAEEDENALVEKLLAKKKERVHIKAERKTWTETKALADKARQFDRYIFERMRECAPPAPKQPKRPKPSSSPFCAVISASDLHVGKYASLYETGNVYNRQVTRDRLLATTEKTLAQTLRLGTPEKIFTGVGSDWVHIDNLDGGTTRGTPQDTDGTLFEIFRESCELQRADVELKRQVAPVHLVAMLGNHDNVLGFSLLMWLAAVYENAPDVTVDLSPLPRQYVQYGENLLGFTHGDKGAIGDLPKLMAIERAREWGECRHRYWYTGHRHTETLKDHGGCIVSILPSLAGSDRWHVNSGYVGNRKALTSYVVDKAEGQIATLSVEAVA